MKKNIRKLMIVIIIFIFVLMSFKTVSFAAGNSSESTVGDIFSDADGFLSKGEKTSNVINEGQLKDTSDFLVKLLTAIGMVVMSAVGIIIGIQFMVASAEDKAKVKEALIPYIIGCAVIFGAYTIWKIAVNMGQGTGSGGADTSSSGTPTDGGIADDTVKEYQ